ncbi:MAG: hypothetical protein K6F09_04505 [Clostridiales bacterium]|nr:hypothetical protein [Clostridiales bacterium]
MLKKLTAVFLALTVILGIVTVAGFAAEDTEQPYNYRIWEDDDFTTLNKISAGNEAATVIKPGDVIYISQLLSVTAIYYPDADVKSSDTWTATDVNTLAFSPKGNTSFSDNTKEPTQYYTVVDVTSTVNVGTPLEATIDFTIPFPEENTFVGWVVDSYSIGEGGKTIITFYGLWNKTKSDPGVVDDVDDLDYIADKNVGFFQKMITPLMKLIKKIANLRLAAYQKIHDKILKTDPVENDEMGIYGANLRVRKLRMELFFRWLDTWLTPILRLF